MVDKLYPSLSLGVRETPHSFVSRLARLHGIAHARRFCLDIGLTFQKVIDGERETLLYLAEIANVDINDLVSNTIERNDSEFCFKGQRLSPKALRREIFRICSECIQGDIRMCSDRPELAGYGRVDWLFASFRTCPIHNLSLTEFAFNRKRSHVHDFSNLLGSELSQLSRMREIAVARPPSEMENYLRRRFDGQIDRFRWLDNFSFYAAAKTCENFGAMAVYGSNGSMPDFDSEQLHRAGDVGYRLIMANETQIENKWLGVGKSVGRRRSFYNGKNGIREVPLSRTEAATILLPYGRTC